jgi:hypothetical protein
MQHVEPFEEKRSYDVKAERPKRYLGSHWRPSKPPARPIHNEDYQENLGGGAPDESPVPLLQVQTYDRPEVVEYKPNHR